MLRATDNRSGRHVSFFYLLSSLFTLFPSLAHAKPISLVNSTVTASFRLHINHVLETHPAGLIWHDLEVSTLEGKQILQPFSGFVGNGRVCGLIGNSGSGKSTFLASLAGLQSLPISGSVHSIQIHKSQEDSIPKLGRVSLENVAWLQQQDNFFHMLTVRETLEFATFLDFPHIPFNERIGMVQSHLHSLGLAHVSDRVVGDFLGGGSRLSGGERRRLSVALELLTKKELFIADEPTSGLDTRMSAVVMKLIKDLAVERNIPCICALHQPRSSIWHALDSVIVMAPGGRVVFAGAKDDVVSFFEKQGYPCPEATNPAEFVVDLISINTEDPVEAVKDETRIQLLASTFRAYQEQTWQDPSLEKAYHPSETVQRAYITQSKSVASSLDAVMTFLNHRVRRFGALLRRSWRQNIRNVKVNLFRVLGCIGNAFLLAQIFPTVRGPVPTSNSIADRVALLSFGAINLCMMAYMKTVNLFSNEKPVVRREITRRQYSNLEYLFSKLFAELPIDAGFSAVFTTALKHWAGLRISWASLTATFSLLTVAGASLGFLMGSLTDSEQMATSAGIPLLVILMVVGVINPSGVDPDEKPASIIRLVKLASPFAFAIEALTIGEFQNMTFKRKSGFIRKMKDLPRLGALAAVRDGNQVLAALGLDGKSFNGAMRQLAHISIANLLLSWIGLASTAHTTDREQTESPAAASSGKPVAKSVPTRVRI